MPKILEHRDDERANEKDAEDSHVFVLSLLGSLGRLEGAERKGQAEDVERTWKLQHI